MLRNNKKPFVIVLSRNYSTGLGIVRSLGAAGYSVDLIASVKKKGSSVIAASSKYIHKTVEVLSTQIQGDSGEGILAVLREYARAATEKIVLFPTDDFTASIIFTNSKELKRDFWIPGIVDAYEDMVKDIMNKSVQSELAQKAGLLTPLEWMIRLDEKVQIPDDMIYPCFVKPLQSISGSKTEMASCADKKELEQHLLKMKANYENRTVLVQQFLNIEKEYDLSGVCFDQQIIIPGIIEKQRIARYENGVTMVGKMLSVETIGDTREQLITMLRQFHYEGMFDMELNVCDGKVYFNEINFRSGGPNYAYYLNGVNLPDLFVRKMLGEELPPVIPVIKEYGKTFVYEKVAWEDYIYGYMKKKELKACLEQADFTLLSNKEDPQPGQYFNRRIRLSAVKQRLKRLIRRNRGKQ